jgi:Transmembrane amino acid transporter protein
MLLGWLCALALAQRQMFKRRGSGRGGQMLFAYGGHNIALEIQATLPSPPSTVGRMMRGVWAAFILTPICYYTVAISGYWAYGRTVVRPLLPFRMRVCMCACACMRV